MVGAAAVGVAVFAVTVGAVPALAARVAGVTGEPEVAVSEVAWMGPGGSANDEWIELVGNVRGPVVVDGWRLEAADGTPSIALAGTIPAGGYLLLERSDDESVPGVAAEVGQTPNSKLQIPKAKAQGEVGGF